MKAILGLVALLAAPATIATPADAAPRAARCLLTSTGIVPYRGPCLFEARRGGSFTVSRSRRRPFRGPIVAISVEVTSPGVGEAYGLSSEGENASWGTVRRSRSDAACWEAEEFAICAY